MERVFAGQCVVGVYVAKDTLAEGDDFGQRHIEKIGDAGALDLGDPQERPQAALFGELRLLSQLASRHVPHDQLALAVAEPRDADVDRYGRAVSPAQDALHAHGRTWGLIQAVTAELAVLRQVSVEQIQADDPGMRVAEHLAGSRVSQGDPADRVDHDYAVSRLLDHGPEVPLAVGEGYEDRVEVKEP